MPCRGRRPRKEERKDVCRDHLGLDSPVAQKLVMKKAERGGHEVVASFRLGGQQKWGWGGMETDWGGRGRGPVLGHADSP